MELKHTWLGMRGERWSTARGTLEIRVPAPDVLVRRFEGHASIHFVEPMVKHLEAALATGVRPIVFDDFELGAGYDSEVRVRLTGWHTLHSGELKEVHILVKSGLLAMGVSVANLATGGAFISYSDRAAFEWALARVMATRLTTGPDSTSTSRAPSQR
jgi:hypothetical protein